MDEPEKHLALDETRDYEVDPFVAPEEVDVPDSVS
jgi:hypothetical protein